MTMVTHTKLFDTHAHAADAVRDLEAAGFSHDEISIMGNSADRIPSDGKAVTADSAGATEAGASVGTVVGGGVGLLAGLGALAIPGVGPIVAAGWLVALLTGAGAGAAAGGLLGSFAEAGVDEKEAHVYAEGVRRGGTIVTVRTEEARSEQADRILARHASVNLAAREADYRANGWTGYRNGGDAIFSGMSDGTPGNSPGTMASRAADDLVGTNISGARPENDTRRL
jgi:hypothetical protein